MTLSLAILDPTPADLARAHAAAPCATVIAVAPPDDDRPWGAVALDRADGGPVLLLHAGESFVCSGELSPGASRVAVDLRRAASATVLPPPFAPLDGPARIELQPRLASGRTTAWAPDGLPTGGSAVEAAITITNGVQRWSRPGAFLDLLLACEASPSDPTVLLASATCFAHLGDPDEARRRAGLVDPRDADPVGLLDCRLALASAELRRGEPAGARDALLPVAGEPEAALLLGAMDAHAGHFEEAERRLHDALRAPFPLRPLLVPDAGPWACWLLADLEWHEGRYAETRAWFARGRQDLPGLVDLRLELLNLVTSPGGQSRSASALTGRFLEAGDYEGAIESAKLAIEAGTPQFGLRAKAFAGLRRHRLAQDDAWTHLALHPGDLEAVMLLGECALALGEWDEAVGAFNYADALDADPRAATRLAAGYLQLGALAEAEIWARRALAKDATDREARLAFARVMAGCGNGQAAYETLAPLLEEYPHDREVCEGLARLLLAADETGLAIGVAREGVDLDRPGPADAPLMLLLAEGLQREGRLTEGRVLRDLALLLAPGLTMPAAAVAAPAA